MAGASVEAVVGLSPKYGATSDLRTTKPILQTIMTTVRLRYVNHAFKNHDESFDHEHGHYGDRWFVLVAVLLVLLVLLVLFVLSSSSSSSFSSFSSFYSSSSFCVCRKYPLHTQAL